MSGWGQAFRDPGSWLPREAGQSSAVTFTQSSGIAGEDLKKRGSGNTTESLHPPWFSSSLGTPSPVSRRPTSGQASSTVYACV